MLKFIKSLIYRNEHKEKYEYVKSLFEKSYLCSTYVSQGNNVKGLIPLVILDYLDHFASDTSLVQIFDILKELETRQVIIKSGYTKHKCLSIELYFGNK